MEWQRLACNMMVIAAEALPRGGTLQITAGADGKGIVVNAGSDSVNLTAELRAALIDGAAMNSLTARTVHGYYTARVAETPGARLELTEPQPGKSSRDRAARLSSGTPTILGRSNPFLKHFRQRSFIPWKFVGAQNGRGPGFWPGTRHG